MSGEKHLKGQVGLPSPVAATAVKSPRRLRNVLVLSAACGLFYLGTTSWNNLRREHVVSGSYRDSLLETSRGIQHRHKGFGLDPKKAESFFLSVPSAESAIAVSRAWTERPHYAGSHNDYTSALEQLAIFQKHLGIKAPGLAPVFDAGSTESRQAILAIPNITEPRSWIDTYYPLLNTPAKRKLEILNDDGSTFWSANVEETPAEGDPASEWYKTVGAWHGLSKGGDVKGKLVHVGYGTKKEFEDLAAAGHDLTGAIVLARYGQVFRGLKIKAAQEAGAVGCLIYSDPLDNGAVTVENGYKSWPQGPALNPDSVQRGSVQFLSLYPGDPTTPGTPAYRDANRTEALNVPSIPSLPISWNNAQALLKELGGTNSVFSTRTVRLLNGVNDAITPIWNTMAVIPGHIRSEVVVLGNHRDAWVLGAGDPTSGTVSVHEITKGLGELLKQGWKPLRTIVLASWDAEEYGLVGSTEWGEDFADWIQSHVVAYVNVDIAASGERFRIMGSPSLAHHLRQAAMDVPHPTDTNRTLWDARNDIGPFTGPVNKDVFEMYHNAEKELQAASTTGVLPLGSGSDYTVFLQRLGVASADQGFSATLGSAVYHYHSIWDSETWMEKYGDPGFVRHVAVAKYMGLGLLRLVDSIILPLNTTQYALELETYLDCVTKLSAQLSDAPDFTDLRHAIKKVQKASVKLDYRKVRAERHLKRALERFSRHHHYGVRAKHHACNGHKIAKARTWVKKVFGVVEGKEEKRETEVEFPRKWPKGAKVTPRIGRLPAWAEEQEERKGGHGHHHRKHKHHEHGEHGHDGLRGLVRAVKEVQNVNKKLSSFERGFISEDGIPAREWYRHLGVAPGKWLGYGATTLPALTEAITIDKNATLAAYEAERLTRLLENLAEELK